jgi:hydrogenase nickel incorporation protein HypA/HybF
MSQIVEVALEEAKRHDAIGVKQIQLEIGELTFLGVEQMKFAYEVLSEETILKDAELCIEEQKAVVKCDECGYEGGIEYEDDYSYHLNFPKLLCPVCNGHVTIISGRECMISKIMIIIDDGNVQDR